MQLAKLFPQLANEEPQAIFGDASFKAGRTSLQESRIPLHAFYQKGNVNFATVWMRQDENWRTQPITILRYVDPDDRLGVSSYSGELLCDLASLRASAAMPLTIPLYSDCLSAIHTAMAAQRATGQAPITRRYGSILAGIASVPGTLQGIRDIRWVPSHPEVKKPHLPWTPRDWGIWLADKAAAGEWEDIMKEFPHCIYKETPFETAHKCSLPKGVWHWRSTVTKEVEFRPLQVLADVFHHNKYCEDRDKNRADRNLPPQWTTVHTALAAFLTPASSRKSFTQNMSRTRTIFDWHTTSPAFIAKTNKIYLPRTVDAPHPEIPADLLPHVSCACGALGTVAHLIIECQLPAITTIRETALMESNERLRAFDLDGTTKGLAGKLSAMGHRLLPMLQDRQLDVDLLWRGLFQPVQIEFLMGCEGTESMAHSRMTAYFRRLQILMEPVLIAYVDITRAMLHRDDLPVGMHSTSQLPIAITLPSATQRLLRRKRKLKLPPKATSATKSALATVLIDKGLPVSSQPTVIRKQYSIRQYTVPLYTQ